MAKVKFPLKMADEAQVRNLEELREHFDLASVLGYYDSGRLVEWLTDRYYEDEAEKISVLDSSAPDFKKCLCDILGAAYVADDLDMADIAGKNERRERLKQFTADDKILAAVDRVAFSQEELADLLDENVKEIYLCGESFSIPLKREQITYIGVNKPIVNISAATIVDFESKGIVFKDIEFCESYAKLLTDKAQAEANEARVDKFLADEAKKIARSACFVGEYDGKFYVAPNDTVYRVNKDGTEMIEILKCSEDTGNRVQVDSGWLYTQINRKKMKRICLYDMHEPSMELTLKDERTYHYSVKGNWYYGIAENLDKKTYRQNDKLVKINLKTGEHLDLFKPNIRDDYLHDNISELSIVGDSLFFLHCPPPHSTRNICKVSAGKLERQILFSGEDIKSVFVTEDTIYFIRCRDFHSNSILMSVDLNGQNLKEVKNLGKSSYYNIWLHDGYLYNMEREPSDDDDIEYAKFKMSREPINGGERKFIIDDIRSYWLISLCIVGDSLFVKTTNESESDEDADSYTITQYSLDGKKIRSYS